MATEALQVVLDEGLIQAARTLGAIFRSEMQTLVDAHPELLTLVRGKGLLNALVINDSPDGDTAWVFCLELARRGLLAKPTHGNIIRFAPPLVISESQLAEACGIIGDTVRAMAGRPTLSES